MIWYILFALFYIFCCFINLTLSVVGVLFLKDNKYEFETGLCFSLCGPIGTGFWLIRIMLFLPTAIIYNQLVKFRKN